jgi:type IV secretion system protein VirB11
MVVSTNTLVQERAIKSLKRDIGPKFLAALNDPSTVEIVLNADGKLWQEKLGQEMVYFDDLSPSQAQAVLETVAGFHGRELTPSTPIIEAEFPIDGSRFAGQIPPIVTTPIFALRKKAVSIFTLDQYVDSGIMTQPQKEAIQQGVKNHRNILVIGGTGTGKTTLVNSIINEMVESEPTERVVILEDTGEIQCSAVNHVQYHTSLHVSMTDLLKTTLRMRPDRILVGEVRGPEALDLLMAWNTGHEGGAATLHANNAKAGLSRLAMLISMNATPPDPIEPLIGEAVHMVVHIARTKQGRIINEIIEVSGYENGRYITKSL